MELGKARLRKVGINNLSRAVHPHHGVMWTDGRGIYLAPLHVEGKQMQNATSVRLGEFDTVTSVHWSNPIEPPPDGDNNAVPPSCHMAVVHQNNVTVWRVSGSLPKLSFKQVRKINVRPIAQGCLWNPMSDTLCLLSRHQCSFYFRHDHNKGSYAVPPLESGKISCGSWSSDGKKLILCIGATLLIYRWPDVSMGADDGHLMSWIVPGLVGDITSITPMPKNNFVLATEVPLESLCRKPDSRDAFIMPDSNQSNISGNDDVIRPSNSPSLTQGLMNLQTNTHLREASSSLILIKVHEGTKEPSKVFSCSVNGLLTPDILLYEKSSQCVVVGSNSQSQLHIYALLEKRLAYCGDIQLDKSQRPKGLCSVPTYFDDRGAALLILVGQRAGDDAGFLSASTETDFQLSLKYIIIKAGYESKTKESSHGDSFKSRSSANMRAPGAIGKSESMRERNSSVSSDNKLRLRSGSGMSDASLAVPQNNSSFQPPPSPLDAGEHTTRTQSQITTNPSSRETPSPRTAISPFSPSPSSPHRSTPSPSSLLIQSSHQPDASPSSIPTSSSASPHQKPPLIHEMRNHSNTTTTLSKEDLEVDTISFSSQQPSFSNDKLSSKYELGNDNYRSKRREIEMDIHVQDNSRSSSSSSSSQQPKSHTGTNSTNFNSNNHQQHQHQPRQRQSDWKSATNSLEIPRNESSALDKRSVRMKNRQSLADESPPVSSGNARNNHQGRSTSREDNKRLSNGQSKDDLTTSDLGSSQHSADSSFDSMEKQVRNQKDSIEALYRRLEELSESVQEVSMVFPTKYQDMNAPELITITCTKAGSDDARVSKKFLLDNGRLQLEPIKLAFGLATVELWLDGVPIVLGANIDGYIPLKFSAATGLHISGMPAETAPAPQSLDSSTV